MRRAKILEGTRVMRVDENCNPIGWHVFTADATFSVKKIGPDFGGDAIYCVTENSIADPADWGMYWPNYREEGGPQG